MFLLPSSQRTARVQTLRPEGSIKRFALEASLRDLNVIALVGERGGLPGDQLQVVVDAVFVADVEQVKRLLRGVGGVVLLSRFGLDVVQSVQIVFYLLECGQCGLAVRWLRGRFASIFPKVTSGVLRIAIDLNQLCSCEFDFASARRVSYRFVPRFEHQ